ncbi:3-hydroxyacyl-CoA dehydrogenase [Burkholderia sp. FL-7-2-10-S1-D7]|uniref:3-hydroxyacyl-CoA dehydrogenase NAD-binding domain-containing protein n=1 Tax=Burkholderia sp. FL-7-2-10-S1-D7 TaxID=1637866 RepID=UPI00075B89CF|nr:3-hydroxyacyl-CoA dehydrogenase NAD-binding domain-containing protein [Burkholderia sp. FL-7-2-10-S1-D7]KVF79260.1 3-hydroxyacyl-CoA dehydrogenase [Burkholderia sp. FL-7-2-10-S1-D7]
MSYVTYSKSNGIAVATIDNPPINALSIGVRRDLLDAIERAQVEDDVQALIIACAGRTFVAGADISEFGKPYEEPSLYKILDALGKRSKPTIAAIHGTALGGGLELALSCTWRVARSNAQIGQPEVKLGLMPGGYGTQWWLRLAGPQVALDVSTSGNPVSVEQAHEWGVIDHLVTDPSVDLVSAAIAFAQDLINQGTLARDLSAIKGPVKDVDLAVFDAYRQKNQKKWHGLVAPQKIVDVLEASCALTFDEGCALEQKAFQACEHSPESAALRHLFFAEREASKIPGTDNTTLLDIKSVAVIGAGTMGQGIAQACASAGMSVVLVDHTYEALERAIVAIQGNYETSVARGSMARARADRAFNLISISCDLVAVSKSDLIIEAVFEDLHLKQSVFRDLDAVAKPEAILATNTSTLDIDLIANVTRRPQQVVGMHFFSPAHVMKLVEVIMGSHTSNEVSATILTVTKALRKIAVFAGNEAGFIGNRILGAYGREADYLLEEGATPWQIDRVLNQFGFPMGLFAMRDMAGLDVIWRIRQERERNGTRPDYERYSVLADRICELGRFGQKTGCGYYRYEGRTAIPCPEIEALLVQVSADAGIERSEISDEEIVQRIMCVMVNEGARILDSRTARRAGDIDIVYTNGYGFPSYRGGPMFWAQQTGLQKVYEKIQDYNQRYGDTWRPAQSLAEAAKTNQWPVYQA